MSDTHYTQNTRDEKLDRRLEQLHHLALELLGGMLDAVGPRLKWDGDRAWLPYGALRPVDRLSVSPDEPPSARLSCDLGLGFLAAWRFTGNEEHLAAWRGLLRHALTQQRPDGRYVWNYGQYETDQVDLGTVLDTFYYGLILDRGMPDELRAGIERAAERAIAFLNTMGQPDYPGVIRKRAADPERPEAKRSANYLTIDVINGNTLAVTAYCRAADILKRPDLRAKAATFRENLLKSFGRHVEGWWVYVEKLEDRAALSPESILFQAMMALYLLPLWQANPKDDELADLLNRAVASCARQVRPDGTMDWTHEHNAGFRGSQQLMLTSAATALANAGLADFTDAALARLRHVAENLRAPDGLLLNEAPPESGGQPADELRQIWATSDLALIALNARTEKTT